jgi:peptidoglycan hydrolase CwlO-like protein
MEIVSERVRKILEARDKVAVRSASRVLTETVAPAEITTRTNQLESEISRLKSELEDFQVQIKEKDLKIQEVQVAMSSAEAQRRVPPPKLPEPSKEMEILRAENEDLKRKLGGSVDGKQKLSDALAELKFEKEINDELKRRLDDKVLKERQTLSQAMAQERVRLNDFLYSDDNRLKTTPFPPQAARR